MKLDRILVVRTDRLGDMVLCLPLIQEIARQLPDAEIDVMCREYTVPLITRHPDVSGYITVNYDDPASFFGTVSSIYDNGYDAAIVVNPMLDDTLAVALGGARFRVGNGYRGYSFLYNRPIFFHRSKSDRHELEYNLLMLKGLRLAVPDEPPVPIVPVLQEDGKAARALLPADYVDRGYVVLHPGSGGSSLNWPLGHYIELAKRIVKETGRSIVVTGSADEAAAVRYLADAAGGVSLAGRTDFSALVGVLAGASLFISSNTGPMHVAAGLATPCLAFFSPWYSGGPTRWGPRGSLSVVLKPPDTVCEKCTGEKCEYYNCMERITVERAFENAVDLIRGSGKNGD
ncbi:MAG: glycosyltransferase family 9 protein [bacterium]|nr:glycosyltransferase family 9 protein [bacterium]